MITAKSYKSQVKRGTKLLFSYQLTYLNDLQFSRLMQDAQLTRHTVPNNTIPYASQPTSNNNAFRIKLLQHPTSE